MFIYVVQPESKMQKSIKSISKTILALEADWVIPQLQVRKLLGIERHLLGTPAVLHCGIDSREFKKSFEQLEDLRHPLMNAIVVPV